MEIFFAISFVILIKKNGKISQTDRKAKTKKSESRPATATCTGTT